MKGSGQPNWLKYDCDKEICTGFLCTKCWLKDWQSKPGNQNDLEKKQRKWRTGRLRRDSSTGKSIIDEIVVCRVLNVKCLNIEMDNLNYFIDTEHDTYGRIDIKSSCTYPIFNRDNLYETFVFDPKKKQECDAFILLGYDFDRKNIIKVWIIPNEDWLKRMHTLTIRNTYIKRSKYAKYEVDPKLYNDEYHSLDFENDPLLIRIFGKEE